MMPMERVEDRASTLADAVHEVWADLTDRPEAEFPHAQLSDLESLGNDAGRLVADWYDAMTEEELEEEFDTEVEMVHAKNVRISYEISFSRAELARIRRVAGKGPHLHSVIHTAAMAYIDQCDEKGWYGGDAGF